MKEDFFSFIDSEAKAYWLGFMFADGNVYEQPNGRKAISVTQKEADHPASFLNLIGSAYKVQSLSNRMGTWHRAQVYSEQMFQDLVRSGCTPKKSLTLMPPKIDLGTFTRDFIRGYNDGDGGFYLSPRPRMRMRGTEPLLSWIKGSIPAGSLLYPNGPTAQLFVCKRSVLCDTIEFMYSGASIYLERKYEVAMKIVHDRL